MTTDLRYPAGRFELPQSVSPAMRAAAIEEIAALAEELRRQDA